MEDKEALDFRARRLDELQTLLQSTRRERFTYAEKLTDRKKKSEAEERFRETLLLWLSFWRDVLLRATGSEVPAHQRGLHRGCRCSGGQADPA